MEWTTNVNLDSSGFCLCAVSLCLSMSSISGRCALLLCVGVTSESMPASGVASVRVALLGRAGLGYSFLKILLTCDSKVRGR